LRTAPEAGWATGGSSELSSEERALFGGVGMLYFHCTLEVLWDRLVEDGMKQSELPKMSPAIILSKCCVDDVQQHFGNRLCKIPKSCSVLLTTTNDYCAHLLNIAMEIAPINSVSSIGAEKAHYLDITLEEQEDILPPELSKEDIDNAASQAGQGVWPISRDIQWILIGYFHVGSHETHRLLFGMPLSRVQPIHPPIDHALNTLKAHFHFDPCSHILAN
jgi:hypothetical protein